uniref:At1g61320/AtMIF1 LRR domain-containing protein n=2 Tax=Triticum urartu TaxID=4572 RepID=A0A8R7UPM9_TRIUA
MLKLPAMLTRIFLSVRSIPGLHDRVVITSELLRTNSAVAHVKDSILTTRSPDIAISKLRIRFILTQDDSLTIAKSVAHAMAARKVDAAEFEITTKKAYKISSPDDLVRFGKQFNDFIGACPDAFAGLRCLWLRNMRFGELDIPNILSTCKLLESLHLTYCDSGIHSVLQVEHALLVELEVDYGQFERIELICLPKLQRVSYTGWYSHEDPLYFAFVPQLSKLSLTKTGVSSDKTLELTMFLANVPAITDLHLDFRSEKIWVLPECPKLLTTMLSKLQHVNLDNLPEGCDLGWTPFILEAAPSLKALCITVWDHWCIMATDKEFRKENGFCEKADVKWKPYAAAFKHKNLAKLTIYGLQLDDNFMRYIRCVVEAAVNMIEIYLHDRKMCGRCGDLDPEIKDKVCPSRYPRTPEERKRAVEGLGLASPALIHFRS